MLPTAFCSLPADCAPPCRSLAAHSWPVKPSQCQGSAHVQAMLVPKQFLNATPWLAVRSCCTIHCVAAHHAVVGICSIAAHPEKTPGRCDNPCGKGQQHSSTAAQRACGGSHFGCHTSASLCASAVPSQVRLVSKSRTVRTYVHADCLTILATSHASRSRDALGQRAACLKHRQLNCSKLLLADAHSLCKPCRS
jgi:hypothetical protein